jgi:hypothetical protein
MSYEISSTDCLGKLGSVQWHSWSISWQCYENGVPLLSLTDPENVQMTIICCVGYWNHLSVGTCWVDVVDPMIPLRMSITISNAGECSLSVVTDSDLSKLLLLESVAINCWLPDLGRRTHWLLFCAVGHPRIKPVSHHNNNTCTWSGPRWVGGCTGQARIARLRQAPKEATHHSK